MINPWVAVACLIIVVMGNYAVYLHWKLWRQRQRVHTETKRVGIESAATYSIDPKQYKQRRMSVYILAGAIEEELLTLTEGCIRICAVVSQLREMQQFNREYGVLASIAKVTAHIPILEDWKALSKEEKRRYERERKAIEQTYKEAAMEAVVRLRQSYRP